MMRQLIKALIATLFLAGSLAHAQVYEARGDIQFPNLGLTDLTFMEDAYIPLQAVLVQDGDVYTNIADLSASFIYGTNASGPFITATNTTKTADDGAFFIPVTTNQTGTAGTYWYTLRYTDTNSNPIFTGTGTLTIVANSVNGGGSFDASTPIDWSLYTYSNTTAEGPVRPGSGFNLTTNADGSVTWAADVTANSSVIAGTDINVSTSGTDYTVSFARSTLLDALVTTQATQQASIDALPAATNINTLNGTQTITGTKTLNSVASLQFSGGTGTQGKMSWNSTDETVDLITDGSTMQLGQELVKHVRNESGATITNGTPVAAYAIDAGTDLVLVREAIADGTDPIERYYGVATADIANNANGKCTIEGKVRDINTLAFSVGDELYVSATTAGELTATKPAAPNLAIYVGLVLVDSATVGVIDVGHHGQDDNAYTAATNTVTLDGAQTITGAKTFDGDITLDIDALNNQKLKADQDDGSVIVCGGTDANKNNGAYITLGGTATAIGDKGQVDINMGSNSTAFVAISGSDGNEDFSVAADGTINGYANTWTNYVIGSDVALAAAQLTGTIADARLSANVPMLDTANDWAEQQDFQTNIVMDSGSRIYIGTNMWISTTDTSTNWTFGRDNSTNTVILPIP